MTKGYIHSCLLYTSYVSCGEELQIIGTWVNHPTFGDQFKVETFERSKPATSGAILKYLSSGAIKGVGAATAAKIVEMFGEQTLDIIEPVSYTHLFFIKSAHTNLFLTLS